MEHLNCGNNMYNKIPRMLLKLHVYFKVKNQMSEIIDTVILKTKRLHNTD